MIENKSHEGDLFDFLLESGTWNSEIFDAIKYDSSGKLFYYGDNFKYGNENLSVYGRLLLRRIFENAIHTFQAPSHKPFSQQTIILNHTSFTNGLTDMGFSVVNTPWKSGLNFPGNSSFKVFSRTNSFLYSCLLSKFNYFLTDKFKKDFYEVVQTLETYYSNKNIVSLMVNNDLSVMENLSIKAFENLGKPSFVNLHGLPARYNSVDDNRAKYLTVWGRKIKENYIKAGVGEGKIIVTGHPNYSSKKRVGSTTSLSNVLVLTKAIPGKVDGSNICRDRSESVLYLLKIQEALKKNGVSSVGLRCHPSENINWYYKYIDKSFFKNSNRLSANECIKNSTLIIGPSSTMVIQAAILGVNYIIYEDKGLGISKKLVPPFDKSDPRFLVAFSQDELNSLICDSKIQDIDFLDDYIGNEFNLSEIQDLC